MTERDIFLAALEIDDLDARQAHVESACAGDTELLSRVQALLASHESQSQFLDTPAVEQISAESHTNSDATIPEDSVSTNADDSDDNRTRDEVAETMIEDSAHMSEHSTFSFLSRSENPKSIGRLGHYEVEEVLGKGAFGIVFKAFDEKLHRVVAIKVLAPEMAATSPARKRFSREAKSSAQVRHENVVAIYAVEEEPIPYLVMEYIPGKTLQDRLNEHGPLEIPEVLRLGKQIADGLAAANAQGLIHRDIKPGNILLDTSINDHVKITDFGLARAADDASVTQSGVIAGTPMYMAPEQAQGQKLDTRADLFSLGSVLYQMVSGRPPFRAPSTVAVLKRVVDEEPRPIREIIPETPNWLCEIIGKLHAKDPEKRFQSAGEVSANLAQCLKQYQQDGVVTGVEKSDMEADIVVTKVEKSKPAGGSNSTWWWLGGVSLVLLALIYVAANNLFNPQSANNSLTDNTPENAPIPSSFTALPGWQGWPIDAPPPAIAPFTAEEAKMYQVAWATYLGVPVEYTNSIGMKFRLIPPGEFMMGSSPEEIVAALEVAGEDEQWREQIQSEAPQHNVILTQPVYVGVTEVTQAQYEQVMGTNLSHFSATGEGKDAVANLETSNHPVEMVSWNDAAEFCAKLSQQEKLKPFYFRAGETITPLDGTGYRLPTEAEWESACRAGTTTRFWSGDEDQDLVSAGWFGTNSGGRTHAAGELKANPFGLWAMHGNVYEWVQDSWDPAFYWKSEGDAAVDAFSQFSAGSRRVQRGGSWFNYPSLCRSSFRGVNPPATRFANNGFRVVLPVDAVKAPLQRSLTESSPVELFNGKDLTGWKMHPDTTGNWRVENGELISDGKPSYLFSELDDYGDFELNCEVSISDGGDSGLIVRSPFEKVGPNGLPGYEAQIQAGKVLTPGWATGAIAQSGANTGWSLKQSSSISVPPNEYFTLKVRVAHNRVKTYVNGVQVAEYVDPAWTYQRGHIALQHSGAQTVIRFRKITLTELVPEQPTTTPANFALQFDGVDDYVEWADLPFPNRQPFKVEFAATVEEIPDDDKALYLLNWGRAVFINCRHDDHSGPILYLQLLTDDGSIHAWSIVDKLIQGTRFDFVVQGRNGVVELTWNGETIPESSYVYKQFRNEQDLGSSAPQVVEPVATDSFCFLGVPTSSPKALQGAAYCGKIHSLRLSEGANADIAKFDFSHDTGDTLRDLSGNGHDGKIVGATWVRVDATPNLSPPSQFALQFDGMDDCVEWSELPVPLDRPVRIELAATVDSNQADAESGIPIFNWGGAVAVSAEPAPNIGDVLTVQFLSDPGVHHAWHIRNAVEAGRRFSLVVDFRDGVANFSVDGRPVPTSQLRYGLHRDGEWNFDAQPETFRLFSNMKRSFLATPSTHPNQKSMALHGKVHHLKLTQDAGDTIAEFDFTKGSGDILRDVSGNGHDGKIVGAKWVRRDGPHSPPRDRQASDVSLQFDGVDDYVDLGENIAVDFDQPLTLEAWVWADRNADVDAHQAIISLPPHQLGVREKGEGKWQHLIWADPLQSQSLATVRSRQLKRPVKTDGFVHLASVWQGNAAGKQLQLFLDGELIHTLDITEPLSISDQFRPLALLGIEQIGDELVNPFAGMIREVRISNTARYSKDFAPAERFEADEHTLALYHFDEGQGDVLKDASGNGHDGKIVGATWVRTGPPTTVAQNQFDWSTLWPADAPPPAIAPFTAEEAKAHQEAWAKYLGVPVEYENSIGMKFRLIPPGEFMMGSTPDEIEAALKVAGEDEAWRERIKSEAPQHKVVLTQPVYVGVTEVTQSQYEQIMGTNPSHFAASGAGKDAVANLETGNYPVEMVSWNDAAEFCAKLSQQEQLKPFYFRSAETVTPLDGGSGYRLPTEAEWESACRAGTTTRFWSGDEDQDLVSAGWFIGNSDKRTHAAGELKANPFGLSDVHGNVWEWVQDSWDPSFYRKSERLVAINPSSPFSADSQRVLRGGNWLHFPSLCRSSFRLTSHPTLHLSFGFRVVLPVDAVKHRSSEETR